MSQTEISGYIILEPIIQGDYSIFYHAHETSLARDVLIKTLLPAFRRDPDLIGQLQREAQILARLAHPHMVILHEWLEGPEGPCLVMPWYPARLRQKIQQKILPPPVVADLLEQVAAALGTLHLNRIIHGNLSPEHIWLDRAENAYLGSPLLEQKWCIDAEFYKAELSDRQRYAAPEHLLGIPATVESDIFSLGVVCLECLTGHADVTSLATRRDSANSPASAPTLPIGIIDVLRTATHPDPAQRYRSAQRFAASFRAALPDVSRNYVQPLVESLTDRELEILEMMIGGLTNAEMAQKLGIEASTVAWHIRQNIYRKLDVHSRHRAIERGIELGLTKSTPNRSAPSPATLKPATLARPTRQGTITGNPYKGLKPFDEADTAIFFGREALVQQLLASLQAGDQFVTLVGPSGSGKSSVMRAGLVPALRHAALPGSERWLIAYLTPGSQPIAELAVALTRVSSQPIPNIVVLLSSDPKGLMHVAQHVLPMNEQSEMVLVVDQFEEMFTLVDDEAVRQQFIDLIVTAANDLHSRIRILLALRADFYHRPLMYPELAQLLGTHSAVIVPLTAEQLELTITGPAARAGLEVEEALISRIVQDVYGQASALPLLQYTLTELYESREGEQLTLAAYLKSGGIASTLSRRADELFAELEPAGQVAAQQIFLRMITLGEGAEDTLRRVTLAELQSVIPENALLDEVLNLFGRYRLLSFDSDPSGETGTVQIAHEALIQNWQRLRDWLTYYRDDLRIQRQQLREASEWAKEEQNPDFLASGTKLARYEALLTQSNLLLSEQERAFLLASLARRDMEEETLRQQATEKARLNQRIAQLWRIGGFALAAALIIVSVLLVVTLISQREATMQAGIAISHQLAAQALAEAQNPIGNDEYAALLALRSLQYGYDPAADEVLARSVELLPLRLLADTGTMITALAYAADGNSVIVGSIDGSIVQLDAGTGEPIRTFAGHTDEIWKIAISADGQYVLSGSGDKTAILWNAATGQPIHTFTHEDAVRSVDISPDGELILTVSPDGVAKLWRRTAGEEVMTFETDGPGTLSGIFSRDGRYIILGNNRYIAEMWEIATGERIRTFSGHTESVYALALSPDGRYLITGSLDNTARLWDVNTGEMLSVLAGHSSSVRSVAFSPDGRYILTASADRTARLWDVSSAEVVRLFRAHLGRIRAAAMSPAGDYFVTGSEDGTIKLWPGPNYHGINMLAGHEAEVFGAAFSPDSTRIATSSADHTARLWDAVTGQPMQIFSGHEGTVTSVVFSLDGRFLFTGSVDKTARLWDSATGNEVRQFVGHTEAIWSVAYSPDGKIVLTGSYDQTARLWDAATGELLKTFQGTTQGILAVAFSPDGRMIVAGGEDYSARVWDVATGQLMTTLPGHESEVASVTFSPDSTVVLTGSRDNTARLWDAATGASIRTLEGHTNTINGVAFTSDGQYVITASADRSARVWNAADGQLVRIYRGHTNALWGVAVSPDNQQVLTADLGGLARVWELDYQAFMTRACQTLLRDFTELERTLAYITDTTPTCPGDS